MALYGLQKGGDPILVHGLQLPADRPGKNAGVRRIDLDMLYVKDIEIGCYFL